MQPPENAALRITKHVAPHKTKSLQVMTMEKARRLSSFEPKILSGIIYGR